MYTPTKKLFLERAHCLNVLHHWHQFMNSASQRRSRRHALRFHTHIAGGTSPKKMLAHLAVLLLVTAAAAGPPNTTAGVCHGWIDANGDCDLKCPAEAFGVSVQGAAAEVSTRLHVACAYSTLEQAFLTTREL
jgi:hypothetical protein